MVKFTRVEGVNGISLGKINAVVQDKQGFIWLADQNNASVIRYDGYRMVGYRNDPFNDNSLGPAFPETLFADSTGIIWIGLLGMGLDRLDPVTDSFTHYRHRPGDPRSLSNDTVNAIFIDHKGLFWIGTKNGLNLFDHKTGTFTRFHYDANDPNSLSNDHVRSIYEDRTGTIWIGTGFAWEPDNEGGLNRFYRETGKFQRFKHEPDNPYSLIDNKVRAVYEDSRGNFWVGTRNNVLHRMDRATGRFKRYPYSPGVAGPLSSPLHKTDNKFDHISFITEDAEGALWIGTVYSGILRYDTVKKKMEEIGYDGTSGFTDSSGWYAYTSRDGVLWLSTQENHLFRVNPGAITIPVHTGPTSALGFYEENGIVWIATHFGLVAKDRKTWEIVHRFVNDPADPASLSSDNVTSIIKGPGNTLWIGTFGGGLNRFDTREKTFTSYKHVPGNKKSISSNSISRLLSGRDGSLWIGTWKDGLDQMDPKTGIVINYKNNPQDSTSLSQNSVSAICEDKKNRLWVGTGGKGLNLMQPAKGTFRHYLHGIKVCDIFEDSGGIIWVGTSENLYRYDELNDIFTRFADTQTGMSFTSVFSILEDDSSNLWLSTVPGLVKFNKARNQSMTYGKNYGVHQGGFVDAGYKASNNELFFSDVAGHYAFSPDKLKTPQKIPQLIITDFRFGDKSLKPVVTAQSRLSEAVEIKLTHKQNTFSIGFAAIDFRNPDDNTHLFMLEGYDNEWRNAGTERTANFYNLPPRDYILRIKAAGSDGIWVEKSIKISIAPPWWSTWWFRVAAVACIAALFYTLVRWRLQQKFRLQLERSKRERQLAEMRQDTAELQQKAMELEMQALRSQMNPHFIFNSLNSINRFILQNNKSHASEYLTKFSKLVRLILQNSQASLITLESELEALKLYLELEALRFEQHFDYTISVAKDLDIDILRVPPLIIQPYAENAIWHGLMHKDDKGKLEIEILEEDSCLLIKITDNGIGRKKARELASKSTTKHKSLGLKITADRVAMLHTANENNSPVTINDLVHVDGSAAGTEVVIRLPLIQ